MAKEKTTKESIAQVAAEIGSKTALEVYAKQKEKERKARIDRRL